MDIRPIRTDDDCAAALAEIERIRGAADGTQDGDKLEVLATLVEAFESRRFSEPGGTPLDVLRYVITDMGRSQRELADLLGSRSQASDLLKGRRRISLSTAQKISAS